MCSQPKLNAHARAVFAGLCIGDAAGVPREFARLEAPPYPKLASGPRHLMTGGGPFSLAPAQTTDDSATALCVWQSLRACGEYNADDVARLLVNWRRDTFDVGAQTAAALRLIEAGVEPYEAGRQVWEERGRRPAGNGSLMRTAPIAVFLASDPDARRAASMVDSGITHWDPRCQIACAAFNSAIAMGCTGNGSATAVDLLTAADREIDLAAQLLQGEIEPGMVEAARVALHEDLRLAREPDPHLYRPEIHLHDHQGFVRVAIRSAFWHLMHAPTFEAGIADTVLRGGDADTVGAITGALLGALHSMDAIPRDWVEQVLTARPTPATAIVGEAYHPRLFFEPLPIEDCEMDDVTRLAPRDSGTAFVIAVYADFTHRSRYDPRVTVFPGRSLHGGVSISIPSDEGEQPMIVSGVGARFSESDLARVIEFVRINRGTLTRCWNDDMYSTRELLADLLPVT